MLDDTTLYERVLGIETPWFVAAVEPDEDKQTVTVYVALDKTISLSTQSREKASKSADMHSGQWQHFDARQLNVLDDERKSSLTGMFGYTLTVSI